VAARLDDVRVSGLGVLAANASFQEYSGGAYKPHLGYAPIEHDIMRAGHVPMDALAFLLAVQAVTRGAELPRGLRDPQSEAPRAWLAALGGIGAARRGFLGVGDSVDVQARRAARPRCSLARLRR